MPALAVLQEQAFRLHAAVREHCLEMLGDGCAQFAVTARMGFGQRAQVTVDRIRVEQRRLLPGTEFEGVGHAYPIAEAGRRVTEASLPCGSAECIRYRSNEINAPSSSPRILQALTIRCHRQSVHAMRLVNVPIFSIHS